MISKTTMGRFSVIAIILLSYALCAMPDLSRDKFTKFPYTFYHLLTEGFLSGHLGLAADPLPELLKLNDPYDPRQNAKFRLHDASLYHGKYYLYFGPLPVLAVLLPFKLMTGYYAPDSLVVYVFAAIGFIFNFLLLIKIKDKYFSELSELKLYLAGIFVGLSNNTAFLLTNMRTYEDAIISAYCAMSIAIYFLYEIFHQQKTWLYTLLCSTFLCLSVAGRPHFALACCVVIPLISYYLARRRSLTSLLALILPAASIAIGLGLYNYLRFDSFIEFGHRYQVSNDNFLHQKLVLGSFLYHVPLQFYFYFIKPFFMGATHPLPHWMAYLVAGGFNYDFTVGVLTTAPIVSMTCLIPIIYKQLSKQWYDELKPLRNFLLCLNVIFLATLGFLLSIEFIAQRYITDFLPYLLLSAVITWWLAKKHSGLPPLLNKIVKLYFDFTVIMSILTGISFALTRYQWRWNTLVFSDLTILFYYLVPATLGLIIMMMAYMRPLPLIEKADFALVGDDTRAVESASYPLLSSNES